jgi:G6PDH family F420-dependent oxidoreductase
MAQFGYAAICEQVPVKQLVTDLVAAELAGFDFSVTSDHYFPWLEEQGHSGNAWVTLGAAAQATEQLPLMTMVTCPTFRYHPAVVAQQAATLSVLSSGRFTLGLGAGENLNEHVIGAGWPAPRVRHERLAEAAQIIRALFSGEYVNFRGRHFTVERAKLYDLPGTPPPIGIAVSGASSLRVAASHADCMIATRPAGGLVRGFDAAAGAGKPKYGQIPMCYGPDEKAARALARDQWRWSLPGWQVTSELPEPRAFEAATADADEEDVASTVPCGPDVGKYVKTVREWLNAGFTHIALVQVGASRQLDFIAWARAELLPALREL